MNTNVLGQEKIWKLFIKYSVPAIIGMLVLGMDTIIDGYFVGNYIGANGLASTNIAMPFNSIILTIGIIVGIGVQSIIGRSLGQQNHTNAKNAFKTAIIMITAICILTTLGSILFAEHIAMFLGANAEIIEDTVTYIRYSSIFLPFTGLMLVLDYVLKVIGKPTYAMVTLVVSIVLNILLSYIMILQLNIGIKGAALASGFAYCFAVILAVIPFAITSKTVLSGGSFDKKIAYNIIYNGSSEGLGELGTAITTFLFNITLIRYTGELGVAAFTAISYLTFIGTNILLGLSDGIGSIVSYNYGSGQIKRIKKVLGLTAITATIIGITIFFAIFSFGSNLIYIFLNVENSEILNFAVTGAKIYAFAFLISGLNIIASGFFTAIGSPGKSAIIALNKGLIWISIGIIIYPQLFGIQGIWLAVPIAELITLSLSMILFYNQFKTNQL